MFTLNRTVQVTHFLSFTARVIDVSSGKVHVAESCLEETGGLGVDIVLDAGGVYLAKSVASAVTFILTNFRETVRTCLLMYLTKVNV